MSLQNLNEELNILSVRYSKESQDLENKSKAL